MQTNLHTFKNIFGTSFEIKNENAKTVNLQSIVIPIIQRDYAQGRINEKTNRTRENFLNALYNAVANQTPIILDFVYGDIDDGGKMTPLDGQQRLTTLFLLYWYAAKREKLDISEYEFLKKFTYETRYSARDFCKSLIDTNNISFSIPSQISEQIIDQHWFPLEWQHDSTIASMLVMIDCLHRKFDNIEDLWQRLENISFYFLPIKDMGLTDELYIKMNSRGKPLTEFEHFKAEFEKTIRDIDEKLAKEIILKIDIDWTDMLWQYRGGNNIIDDEFMRYFRFICDIICYRNNGSPKENDEFKLLKKYFTVDENNSKDCVLNNIEIMKQFFDCWCKLDIDGLFNKLISYQHEQDKIKIEQRYEPNIFKDCLNNYADILGNKNRKFPLNRIIFLYAVIIYLLNKTSITENQFVRRLRIVNNLIQNSPDQISDSDNRTSGNRMPAILKQVDSIIEKGIIDDAITLNFNPYQISEEKEKLSWTENHPDLAESLFELEDHELLYGQIGIVGLENPENFAKFKSLFDCDWDLVDCALLSIGDYSVKFGNQKTKLGTEKNAESWKYIFHSQSGQTKQVINELFNLKIFSKDVLTSKIDEYLSDCEAKKEFDWRYYRVKYPTIRKSIHGNYIWDNDKAKNPYEFRVMVTPSFISPYTFNPFLKTVYENLDEIDKNKIWLEDYYGYIHIREYTMKCKNSSYVFEKNEEEPCSIQIQSNEAGIDTVDRILFGKEQLKIYLVHKNN